MTRKSGLADSPFFKQPLSPAPPVGQSTVFERSKIQTPVVPDIQSSRQPEIQTTVPELQSSDKPDFQTYRVPAFNKMPRIEARITREQNRYLDDLEWEISRSREEADRSQSQFKRITKNSIIRCLIEMLRQFDVKVEARNFQSEQDLLDALVKELHIHISKYQSSRLPE